MPRKRIALSRDHRSLVMYALMSYMLISYRPSPLLRVDLWGDIPCHPPAGKDRLMPSKKVTLGLASQLPCVSILRFSRGEPRGPTLPET